MNTKACWAAAPMQGTAHGFPLCPDGQLVQTHTGSVLSSPKKQGPGGTALDEAASRTLLALEEIVFAISPSR